MYIRPDKEHLSFRDARAHLALLCHSEHAHVILDRNTPVAILTPLDFHHLLHPGPHDPSFAKAKRLFRAALDELRTH